MKSYIKILISIIIIFIISCAKEGPTSYKLDKPIGYIVEPENGAVIDRQNDINLLVEATDDDGSIIGILYYLNNELQKDDNISPFEYSIDPKELTMGNQTLSIKVFDNDSLCSIDSVTVSILNEIPTCNITYPLNNDEFHLSIIEIRATASDDVQISNVDFYVDDILKQSISFTDTNLFVYSWDSELASFDNHTIKAIARDSDNEISNESIVNISLIQNNSPTCNIASPLNNTEIFRNESLNFDANAIDSDGTIIKVEFYDGAIKLGEDLVAPYGQTWNTDASTVLGTHVITTVATDNDGATSTSDPVNIIINNVLPLCQITSPTNNTEYSRGSSILLEASATDTYKSGKSITKVEFYDGVTKLGEDLVAPYEQTLNTDASTVLGTHVITAVATDNDGAITTSDPLNVIINNVLPSCQITAPVNNTEYDRGSTITIEATATDSFKKILKAGKFITKIEFYDGPTKVDEDTVAPYDYDWTTNATTELGTHIITAVATDNDGATTTSSPVSIIINNVLPSCQITAPANNTEYDRGSTITIEASATDSFKKILKAGKSITKVEFYDGVTKLGEDLVAPYEQTWNTDASTVLGTHVITTVATDSDGGTTTSDPINIIINNVLPICQITTPTNNTEYDRGGSITIEASATDTYKSSKSVSKVEFFDGATKLGEDLIAPYQYTLDTDASTVLGTHEITVVSTDSDGGTTTSDVVNIIINSNQWDVLKWDEGIWE